MTAAPDLAPGVHVDFRFVPDDEMNAMRGSANVIVFRYREMGVAGVLMVALRYRRPIIASRIGGIAEVLVDARHGALVTGLLPRRRNEALCASPEERAAMEAAVAWLGVAIPNWADIAPATVGFYRWVLANYQNQRSGTKMVSPGPMGVVSLAAQRRRSGSP